MVLEDDIRLYEKKLEKKYSVFVEISRLTDELNDVLRTNDRDSIYMIMKMRGEEMYQIDVLNAELGELLQNFSVKERTVINQYKTVQEIPERLERIVTLKRRIHSLVEKIIVSDQTISQRIAGKDSFYKKQKG